MKKIILLLLILSVYPIKIKNLSSRTFSLDIPGNKPLQIIKKELEKKLGKRIDGHFRDQFLQNGKARFITRMQSDYVIVLYWHKTKKHSIIIKGEGISAHSFAVPGEWVGYFLEPGKKLNVYYKDIEKDDEDNFIS